MGKIRLGGTTPEFSTRSWVAMLYSAGMGAGILLRAVQEPVYMQQNPPIVNKLPTDSRALEYVFYQWGFTAWAFYVFFALIMGYYLFIRKKSVLLSSVFSNSKLGRYNGTLGVIDALTLFTTVIGIVAAIGLGAQQIEGGLGYLLHSNADYSTAFLFTLLIFILSFISAYRGLNRGIKLLSNLNISITLLLLFFVFSQTHVPTVLYTFVQAGFHYLKDLIPLSLALGAFNPGKEFLTDWTLYYWAFWLAWAPFTGIFIARISKGRSLRQMILGAILIPSIGSFFWFSVFGTAAFEIIHQQVSYQGDFDNVFTSMFVFLSHYPLQSLTAAITILLLVGYLVTSADSAIFVLSMFTDQGKKEPKKSHRLLWAITMLLMTEAFLIIGKYTQADNILDAMQKLLIVSSLPFAFLTLLIAGKLIWDICRKTPES